jgi:cytochrome c
MTDRGEGAMLTNMTRRGQVNIMLRSLQILWLGVSIGAAASAARADGDVAAGHAMAERLCSRCHAIAGPGPSPLAQAPLFSHFGRTFKVDDLAEAMAEGLVVGHGPMPEFVFTPEEIDDMLAYLNSVQE